MAVSPDEAHLSIASTSEPSAGTTTTIRAGATLATVAGLGLSWLDNGTLSAREA